MSIIKNKVLNNFAMIPNELLADENLSWKAKGVLCYLLSMPYDWKIHTNEIEKHAIDGRESLNTAIKQLIELGYIERVKLNNEKGQFSGYEYSVYNTSSQKR